MIGILGGTFDPVHVGHLRPAIEAFEILQLQQMRVIPCGLPSHRRAPLASAAHRAAMVSCALEGMPGFVMDPRELERSGPSFSVDTLESLRLELGMGQQICMLMGMDAFAGLPSWHRWQTLPELAHIVVSHRPGAGQMPECVASLEIRLTDDVRELHAHPAGRLLFLPVTQLDISATAIRRILSEGRSPRFLLPEPVMRYIERHGLYRDSSS